MDSHQLRVYFGGYRFSDNVVTVAGPRARVEFEIAELPALWNGARLYLGAETQHDDARGSQSFVSIRLRIPLGSEKATGRRVR